ncbi:hypothetical protein [Hyphomonas johnsonii]|uniref:Uncharacterized protein n=1 Tax=Hyphomonas johnsonii MHS-2 TaxID=1280950 RepID=A0A059FP09_9PROT|nr:hypothetical protein [Hyphomonas johnsonii]KCZ92198.1 hypothetical protein HJO_09189 [Hyphomonas johnsonii MHS-2]
MRDSNYDYDVSPWWRLTDKLSVVEASLLVLGIEPQGLAEYIENHEAHQRPKGYAAVKAGIVAGLQNETLKGHLSFVQYQEHGGGWETDYTRHDLSASAVEVDSLINWLTSRGVSEGYFFSTDNSKGGLRDASHPRYAPKLAAAVRAWESFDESSSAPGTAKQRLAKWLRLHAAEYGLTDDDGKSRESVIEQLATIANWATKGGAPKAESPEPFDNDLDDKIPF